MSNENPFAVAKATHPESHLSTMTSSRASQEVQAAMVIAKKFPRDQERAFAGIMQACKRKGLAEEAVYSYPRGGSQVEGPSIRLAETLAQNWGNLDFGVVELEQRPGESVVMAYAWDLETNTRQTKIFTVTHSRKSDGRIKTLDDPRDIYEMVANQGARRVRNCILGVIPGDVVDAAVDACNETLKSGAKDPLIDRVRKMASAFADQGVTIEMLEVRLGHKLDATSENELVRLRKIFTSIRDGVASRDDWFKPSAVEPPKAKLQASKADEKAEAKAGLAPAQSASNTQPTPAPSTPPPAEETPKATTPKLPPKYDSASELSVLAKRLGEVGVSEDVFLAYLKTSGTHRGPLANVEELAEFAPAKLHFIVENFDTKFREPLKAAANQ